MDIDEVSLCLDADRLLDRLRTAPGRYGGVLFVRTYGMEDSRDALFAEIRERGPELMLVDDRCLCRPRFDEPIPPGVDAVLYSTGYAKPVDLGFGGFASLADGVEYRGIELPYDERALERLTASYKTAIREQAPLEYEDGPWLDTRAPGKPPEEYRALVEQRAQGCYERKRRINEIYSAGIPEQVRLERLFQDWRFNILVEDKERLLASIFAAELFASSHYADMTGILSRGRSPVAERLHGRVVNLFNDRYYSEERAERTVALVRGHLGL